MPADPAGEGEVEQLRQLGADLPGLPVDGVAADQDEVEGARGRSAAARARAVARVSEPAKAGSQTCSPASAPQATASRRTSSAPGGPSVTTVQVPPVSRASVTPSATARRQYGFISRPTPCADQPAARRAAATRPAGPAWPATRCAAGRPRPGSPAHRLTGSPAHRLAGRPAVRRDAVRHRPSAAPAGLRGSDAATRRRAPVRRPARSR